MGGMPPKRWPLMNEDILSLACTTELHDPPDLDGGSAAKQLTTHE